MKRTDSLILLAGLLLVVIPFLAEGLALFPHTMEHVIDDLTVELTVHVFLLGILLVGYSLYRYKTRS